MSARGFITDVGPVKEFKTSFPNVRQPSKTNAFNLQMKQNISPKLVRVTFNALFRDKKKKAKYNFLSTINTHD